MYCNVDGAVCGARSRFLIKTAVDLLKEVMIKGI